MRNFELHRDVDVSKVSGTGVVAEGVVFSNGRGALQWLGDMPMITEFHTIEWVEKIHGHDGLTRIVWVPPQSVDSASIL